MSVNFLRFDLEGLNDDESSTYEQQQNTYVHCNNRIIIDLIQEQIKNHEFKKGSRDQPLP